MVGEEEAQEAQERVHRMARNMADPHFAQQMRHAVETMRTDPLFSSMFNSIFKEAGGGGSNEKDLIGMLERSVRDGPQVPHRKLVDDQKNTDGISRVQNTDGEGPGTEAGGGRKAQIANSSTKSPIPIKKDIFAENLRGKLNSSGLGSSAKKKNSMQTQPVDINTKPRKKLKKKQPKKDFQPPTAYESDECIFCEYYHVFGKLPVNMMKRYDLLLRKNEQETNNERHA